MIVLSFTSGVSLPSAAAISDVHCFTSSSVIPMHVSVPIRVPSAGAENTSDMASISAKTRKTGLFMGITPSIL